jgi:hypothetical protein
MAYRALGALPPHFKIPPPPFLSPGPGARGPRHETRGPRGSVGSAGSARLCGLCGVSRHGAEGPWGTEGRGGGENLGGRGMGGEGPTGPYSPSPPSPKSSPRVEMMTVRSLLTHRLCEWPCVSLWGGLSTYITQQHADSRQQLFVNLKKHFETQKKFSKFPVRWPARQLRGGELR